MGITADIFKGNSLQPKSIRPTSLAKRPCDPYVYWADGVQPDEAQLLTNPTRIRCAPG
jgi:hypothetical protein